MKDNPKTSTPQAAVPAPRTRLRMRPPAQDHFTTFVYVCVGLLLAGEFVAMFWLDIFA